MNDDFSEISGPFVNYFNLHKAMNNENQSAASTYNDNFVLSNFRNYLQPENDP